MADIKFVQSWFARQRQGYQHPKGWRLFVSIDHEVGDAMGIVTSFKFFEAVNLEGSVLKVRDLNYPDYNSFKEFHVSLLDISLEWPASIEDWLEYRATWNDAIERITQRVNAEKQQLKLNL